MGQARRRGTFDERKAAATKKVRGAPASNWGLDIINFFRTIFS